MSEVASVKKQNGGARPGAGKKPGSLNGIAALNSAGDFTKKSEAIAFSNLCQKLEIADEFAQTKPLEIMLMAMRHYATQGQWMVAAGIAEKAAKYIHPPKSVGRFDANDPEVMEGLSNNDLIAIAGGKLKKAA